MQIWPGQPYPLGATFDGVGTNFSLFSEVGRARRTVPVRRRRRGNAGRPARSRRRSAGTAICRMSGRASATAIASTALGARAGASGAIPTSCCSIPTRRRSRAMWDWNEAVFPYHFDDPEQLEERSRTARRSCPRSVVVDPSFDWGQRPPPEHALAQDGRLRNARQGLHEAAPGDAGGAARHVRRASRIPVAIEYLQRLGVTAVELLPVHQFVQDSTAARAQACGTTGATTRSATSRRTTSIAARPARRAGAGVQAAGEDAARGRHRGHPRRGLQPHRRGQPPRADAVVQGHRQRRVLPADAGQPPLLHGLHRHRQHAEHAAPARAAADHGQPALLGARDARGRLPVRPRGDARARAARRRPAVGRSSTSSSRIRSSARSS